MDKSIPDERKESETERDGFLSYAAEWHAIVHGIYNGLSDSIWSVRPLPDNRDVQKETHYYKGGYIIGTILQVMLIVFAVLAIKHLGFIPAL